MNYETYLEQRGREIMAAQQGRRPMVFTQDARSVFTTDPQPDRRARQLARLNAKMDRVASLATKRARDEQRAGIRDGVAEYPGAEPSADQMAARWRQEYEKHAAQICAEAKAFYDSRNPHNKEGNR